MRWAIPLVVVLCLSPATGKAQIGPCGDGPCLRRPPPPTHFVIEVQGGVGLHQLGFAIDGVVGVGGQPRGLPLAFYWISELGYHGITRDGAWQNLPYRDTRTFRHLTTGARMYVTLPRRLRLHLDALVGGSHVSADLSRERLPLRTATGWLPLAQLAVGVQLRLFHHLALGLRYKLLLTQDDLAGLRALVGERMPLRGVLVAGLTWHF